MPISFFIFSARNEARPKRPRQAIAMARRLNEEKILFSLSSDQNLASKSSSMKK